MKKNLLLILTTLTFAYATEILPEITVVEDIPSINTTTIENESLINEQTLDEKLLKSVVVNQTQASTNSRVISIRGNNYRATNYYEDGIELYRTANGYTDLSMYYTDNSTIEINPGGSQGIYGPSATGGDLYIKNKKLKDGFHGSIGTTISTNNINVNTSMSNKEDDYYFLLELGALKQDYFNLSDSFKATTIQANTKRVNSDKEQYNGSMKVGYTLNSNSDIAYKLSHMQGKFGNPIQVYDEPWAFFASEALYTRIDDKELTSHWFYHNYKNDNFNIKTRVYYDEYMDVFNFYTSPSFDSLSFPTSTYYDSRLGALTSLGYKYDESNNGKFSLKIETLKHKQVEVGDPTDENYATQESSIGYIHNYNATQGLLLSISAMYKKQDILKAHDFNTSTTEDYNNNEAVDVQFTADYRDSKELSYYLSVSQKNRFASLRELFPFFDWDAEKNIVNPEKSHSIELGTAINLNESILKISMYYNKIKDIILVDSAQYSSFSNEDATLKGIELNINNYSIRNNELALSYAYTQALDKNNEQITQVPKSKFYINDIYYINDKLDFTTNFLYSSKRYDLYNGTRYTLDAYSLLDAQLSYRSSQSLSFKFGIKNILDTNWEFTHGQPAQGRSYFTSLNYNY